MESKLSVAFCWTAVVVFLTSVHGAIDVATIDILRPVCALHCPSPSIVDTVRCRCVGPIGPGPSDPVSPPLCLRRICPRSYIPCYKYQTDSRGCPTCQCLCPRLPTRCPSSCPNGHTYETDSQGCRVCQCKPKPKPVCPVFRCHPCPFGYEKDAKGCDTCRCKTSPVLCGPVCAIYCPGGNVLDSRGCPTCRCKPGGLELSLA